jgi:DNA-binding protein HU-beta
MTKADLISTIAEKTKFTKVDTETIVSAVIDTITEELTRGGEVRFVGFGTFRTNKRAARQAKNPKTGEPIQVAASTMPVFKPGQPLKNAVNAG